MFLLGFLARLATVLHGGGLGSDFGYDSGVYFAAADGLIHGRLPYRDFVLLHPPGLMLVLSPFAFATKFVSDHTAFIGGNLAFTGLGAVNAVFVVVIGRRLGLSFVASVAGGLFAALWLGSVHAENMIRLEPLANLFVLIALYAYARTRRHPSASWLFVMGAALGAATSVKIWYAVPLVVLLAWVIGQVRTRRTEDAAVSRTAATAAVAGAALSIVAINAVFFLLAPGAMWQMVVVDQLGRQRFDASPVTRFAQANDLTSWTRLLGPIATAVAVVVLVLGAGLLLVAAWGDQAWGHPASGRPIVVLVGVQLLVLAVSPSWFAFYADYLTPALAVALAIGVDGLRTARWTTIHSLTRPRAVTGLGASAATLALVVLVVPLCWQRDGIAFPRRLAGAAQASRCVMADSPMALIELNALSRSFSPGCQDWVDVVGRTYGPDKTNTTRLDNTAWQRDARRYLLSGNAFIVVRAATGLNAATRAELERCTVIARAGPYVLYRGRSTRS